jgi:hypothetical protein
MFFFISFFQAKMALNMRLIEQFLVPNFILLFFRKKSCFLFFLQFVSTPNFTIFVSPLNKTF